MKILALDIGKYNTVACDLVRALEIEMQVANTADERWRSRKVKQKNERRDALKAAQLSAVNQLRPVHVPQVEVRQWRALITYRSNDFWASLFERLIKSKLITLRIDNI